MNSQLCPLCSSKSSYFFKDKFRIYYQCLHCKVIFVDKCDFPDENSELLRYNEHNNDVNDINYQNFVKPIVKGIIKDFSSYNIGLDFGAGNGPVISKLLKDENYQILQYDPFFYNMPELLNNKYDYIVCCEVIEHFHNPIKDFKLLKKMLSKNGKLYIMTSIYNDNIDFKTWYYKNDKTHVIFYKEETIKFICKHFDFSNLIINNDYIVLSS